MREYRIVRDTYSGYEAQVRRVFFGLIRLPWKQLHRGPYSCNTSSTLELAKRLIEEHKRRGEQVYIDRG